MALAFRAVGDRGHPPDHRIREEHYRWIISESAIAFGGWIQTLTRRRKGIPFRIAREAGLA